MAKVKIQGHASGTGILTVTAPNTSTDRTITLPDATGTLIADDGSGNVGIGVTPESWQSGWTAQQIGARSNTVYTAGGAFRTNNAYRDSVNSRWEYQATDQTCMYELSDSGAHVFYVAPSGTADAAISWTTAMTIDNDGIITKPTQPAFSVNSSTTQSDIGTGVFTTVAFDGERFDQNADFTSNTFTAPVTGKYQLSANVTLLNIDSGATFYILRINTSNIEYRQVFDPDFGQDNAYWSLQMSVLADMDASDTATIGIYQEVGDAQTDIFGEPRYTNFTGYLVA